MIDYLAQRKQQEAALQDLIRARNVGGEINQTRSNINASQGQFLGGTLNNVLGGLGVSAAGAVSPRMSAGLNRNTEAMLAKQRMTAQRAKSSLLYENAVRMAEEAGYDYRAAQNFARQFVADQERRNFQESEANAARASQRRMDATTDIYAQKGLALQNQYRPTVDPNAYGIGIMNAVLNSLGTAGADYYRTKALKGGTNGK